MDSAAAALLACPACGQPLVLTPGTLGCERGHSFDLARQGYVNLLGGPEPANADTAAMLQARARVHASGLFEAVAAAVASEAAGPRLLEVGAGNSHYLARALGEDRQAVGVALDVSKAAARASVRADPRIAAVVADVWRPLPIRDRCLDAVLCVFAPRNLPEFARVLRASGRLVVATPNVGHLVELRDRYGLLQVPADKAEQLVEAAGPHLELLSSQAIIHTVVATPGLAGDLIAMGPNAFHTVPEQVSGHSVTIDVTVQTFRPLPT